MTIQIGDIVGDYRVIGIAGSGGMGEVYKIEHILTRRIEAMKLLPPGVSTEPDQVQRFEREIQVQARLHHPNIAALYNAVREGGSMALVMEFIEGESLQALLQRGPLNLPVAVDYARQVLCALAYAHDAGVIHRDVAPANIIITPDRVAKLTDFGLARSEADLRLTSSGVPVGSPWYMSPEQVRGVGVIDGRTDLYAVGAVLHEMLTGSKLFDVDGAFAVMRAQVEAQPMPPSSRNAAVPRVLDEIVHRALAKDPGSRFQTADEFRLALENAVANCVPTVPRKMAGWTVPWTGFHPSRAAVLLAIAPVLLAAGFVRVHYFAKAVHAPTAATKPPIPPDAASSTVPEPAQLTSAPAEASIVEGAPTEPAAHPKSAPAAAAAVQASPRIARPSKPERNYAIRVTGAEVAPAAENPEPATPVTKPAHEAAGEKSDTVEASVTQSAAPEHELPVTPEAESQKAPKGGNRFVRALGRINPFKKVPKDEAGETMKPAVKKN